MSSQESSATGSLHTLSHSYELNGRVSTHPATARGYSCMNCHLLIEGDDALLLDLGLSVHQEAILDQLRELLSPTTSLTLMPIRFGEFASVCNARAIVEQIGAKRFRGTYFGRPDEWLNFRPELATSGAPAGGKLADLETLPLHMHDLLDVDADGVRQLDVFLPPLRLVPFAWVYDRASRTLFSTDLFGWVSREVPEGPWEATSLDDDTTPELIRDHLIHNRYWWLAGGNTRPLREGMAATFEQYDVETIAPGYGCVLRGYDIVNRHVQMLDDVLAALADEPSIGVDFGTWPLRGVA